MGNSSPGALRRSEEKISSRCGAAGASTMDTTPDQRQKCFRDILDLVLHLSDEEWKAVSRDMEKEVTRLDFASGCTDILETALSAVVLHLLKPLHKSFGIEAILAANNKLKSNLSKRSVSHASDQRSPTEVSDFICDLSQRIVTEIKGAMLEAIQSTASQRASSPAGDPISQLDDLSIACTNEICEKILDLYLAEEHVRPEGEKTPETSLKSHQEVHGVMKGLEEVDPHRSSFWYNVKCLISELISTKPQVVTPHCSLLAPQTERPLSDEFMSKASQMVSEVLQKTEKKLATSMLPQTTVPASSETELNFLLDLVKNLVTSENIQESVAVEQLLEATNVADNIMLKRLCSHIFSGLPSAKSSGSSTSSSLSASVDLNQVAVDIINSVISGSAVEIGITDMENRVETWLGEAQQSDADARSSCYSKSSSDISLKLQNLSGLEDQKPVQQFTDAETRPSVQNSPYVSLHFFTVVRDRLKAFFTTFSEGADDDKRADEDLVGPNYIGEDVSVHELTKPPSPEEMIRQQAHVITDVISKLLLRNVSKARQMGRSSSDSVLKHTFHFPYQLVYTFVEQSIKTLLQNVVNTGWNGGTKAQKICFVDKSTSCPSTPMLQVSAASSSSVHRAVVEENLKHLSIHEGSLYPAATNQELKNQLGFRFIVKMKKAVIRLPSHRRRRHRAPLPYVIRPISAASHRELKVSKLICKKARRTLGRIFKSRLTKN
ncbi:uncharacterized protein LOC132861133 [Tachysurus vachellii]|uniref:uncharacterized protein LOC132861133 n=1 Tax=Tachysurus vachellii TaxID=175792 RepID=UPI00296AC099|nr:uncharacterized protein LOC132861133 [Tachysurus vachellii]